MANDLIGRLREGIAEHPKRWSGDTHYDLGGSADYDATFKTMSEAADTIEALQSENARLRAEVKRVEQERDEEVDTLNAWFDRRELAHDVIDETVLDSVRGYLRTARSGGMDKETSDMIEGVIVDMARLSVFADLFARAALNPEGYSDDED